VSRVRLLRTASFRLAAIYLALFVASALALGAFVYLSIRHEILTDFDERIIEESNSLRAAHVDGGRQQLADMIKARGSGGSLAYGLVGPDGAQLAGELRAPKGKPFGAAGGWVEAPENEAGESPEAKPEIVRALVSRLPDGSVLIVGDEQRRADDMLRGVVSAFAWAVAATIALGALGGLWLSAQFLRRVDAMRLTAQEMMAGDFSRRIPVQPIDDDLSALAQTFNRLFDRIEKLLMANRRVSADIAHDLRKPLARILRRLESVQVEDASLDETRAAAEATVAGIEEALEMFDALLRIGEVEAGARRSSFRPLDLAAVAREVVEAFEPVAQEEGRTLMARLDDPLPIAGDKELLTQMVANLFDNALRHTPAGARIEVAGARTRNGVALSVADEGPGVPAKDLEKIFQPFYRADAARTSPGTGLGLSLVAAIAELHGLSYSASDNLPGLRVTVASVDEDW
jgi:signal transduction histidine kinase